MKIMSIIKEYVESNNKQRIALVGYNSQGKSYQLNELAKEEKNRAVYVASETKSDDNMKNSADKTTLIEWLTKLVGVKEINNRIDEVISKLDITSEITNISVSLNSSCNSYKGLIEFGIKTQNNDNGLPGSGEKFLGQLIMINNILKTKEKVGYEWLIIDEPEVHLHHSLFPLIGKTLKNISENGIKVVIATHSPEILNFFIKDTDEIIRMNNFNPYYLKKLDYYMNIKNDLIIYKDNNYMMDSYKRLKPKEEFYFNEIMKENILKALFAKTIIIGEGIAEEQIFAMLKQKYSDSYYTLNIATIIAFGKCYIPWYAMILKDIGINVISIYDRDENKSKPNDLLKHKKINELINDLSNDTLPIFNQDGIDVNKIEEYLQIDTKSDDKAKSLINEMWSKYFDCSDDLSCLLEIIIHKVASLD